MYGARQFGIRVPSARVPWCGSLLQLMSRLSKHAIALFRVHLHSLPGALATADDLACTVVQDLFLAPLNSVLGRGSIKPAHQQQRVVGPSSFARRFHEKKQDYFDQEVSRRHCTVEVDDVGQVRLRDLASTNGTWLRRSSRARRWSSLAVGRSYRLEPGNRVRLGENSRYAYEYLGLSSDAYIRVRLCSSDNLSLIDLNQWEWKLLSESAGIWSTRDHCDERGRPYHGSPHFDVQLSRSETGSMLARVEFEPSRLNGSGLVHMQASGHQLHGAELESVTANSDTQERELASEEYKVIYELALPGPDKELTSGTGFRVFLETRSLCLESELDQDGWPQTAKFRFAAKQQNLRLPSLELHFRAAKGDEDGSKSFRHAFVRALFVQRLQDMKCGTQSEDSGWVDLSTVQELLSQHELTESRFRSSVYRWRNDVQNKLAEAAFRIQLLNITTIAIADEENWTFLEEEQDGATCRFRLAPAICCFKA